MGWGTPWYIRRKVGNYSAKPDPETRRKVEEHNAFDVELYVWARERFEGRAGEVPELREQARRFRQRNDGIGKMIFLAREVRRRLGIR